MITLSQGSDFNFMDLDLRYIRHRGLISKIVLPITRWLRAANAQRYVKKGERLLDIGCGDGYFLKKNRTKFTELIGVDRLLGDKIEKKLALPDENFDCVTMLAVIEHLDYPWEIIEEIRRVLKPGGLLIFTTPKHSAEWLINLYVKEIHDEHKNYFNIESVRKKAIGFRLVDYRTFILGLNQVFCLEKL